MLGGVHTCRAAAIAFGLFLGHHMAAHRTEPQVFSCHLSSVEVVSRSCFWDGLPDSRLLLPHPTLHGFWFSRPAAQLRRGIVSRRSCGCGVGHETFRSEAPEIEHDALHRDLCHMAAVLSGDVLVGFAADGAHRRSVSFDFSPVVFRCHALVVHSYFWCRCGRAFGQPCLSLVVRRHLHRGHHHAMPAFWYFVPCALVPD